MRVNAVSANSEIQGATAVPPKTSTASVQHLEADEVSLSAATAVDRALEQTPAVRADEVARAKALVADPSYPSDAIIGQVGSLLARW